jgi:hypothetical protein
MITLASDSKTLQTRVFKTRSEAQKWCAECNKGRCISSAQVYTDDEAYETILDLLGIDENG